MYSRNLTFHLKANVAAGRNEAVSISLWDKKESAKAYSRDTYLQVLRSLDKVVEGTPELGAFEVSNSTYPNIAAARN